MARRLNNHHLLIPLDHNMDTGEQIGNTEVEYVVYDESSSGGSIESDGGNELMLEDEDTENDDDLIIKQEHVCGKCNKTYKSFGVMDFQFLQTI